MKVQRLKTAREAWFGIIKTLYMMFGLPFLLLMGLVMLIPESNPIPGEKLGAVIIWAGVFLSVGLFCYGVINRRKLLKRTVDALRDPAYFDPDEGYEIYQQGSGKYLGIDKTNGTILYVHSIRKGQMDILALKMGEWTNREVEGTNIFRLYTKYVDLPRIEIGTPWAQRWYDTLGAMEHKQYSTPKPFKQFVYDRIELLERDLNVHIPRLA